MMNPPSSSSPIKNRVPVRSSRAGRAAWLERLNPGQLEDPRHNQVLLPTQMLEKLFLKARKWEYSPALLFRHDIVKEIVNGIVSSLPDNLFLDLHDTIKLMKHYG